MRQMIKFLAISGLMFAASGVADAKHQITKNVKSGETTYVSDNFNCKGGAVSATISTPPTNGTAKVVVVTEAVSAKKLKMTNFPSCEGKVMKIYYIQYTSKKGYRGSDKIGVTWSGTKRQYFYSVNVK
ncbi:hypothetical protein ABGN05_04020 [Aquibium sp. LZ166]|uniref:Uncharacterized protein n=1 Tax=Aquibium pacificus TaxID=3153579 RepID=A0ABV3SDM2_9HYPH